MSIRRHINLVYEISKDLNFTPLQTKVSASFKTSVRRKVEFPFDEAYNFSYLLLEDGFFFLQEDGSKIILE